jgi:outer membrane protein assembly factor BamE (lipoprotein component of BamABCDE complex)
MRSAVIALLVLALGGCASTEGAPFPGERVDEIRRGVTSREKIREMFGQPWQVGMEDGQPAWRYVFARRSSSGEVDARDLVILFDDEGRVISYRFHTTVGEEHSPRSP